MQITSALGKAPSDIVLEGDTFVSPDTSYAPEETVPGQLFDTVDLYKWSNRNCFCHVQGRILFQLYNSKILL